VNRIRLGVELPIDVNVTGTNVRAGTAMNVTTVGGQGSTGAFDRRGSSSRICPGARRWVPRHSCRRFDERRSGGWEEIALTWSARRREPEDFGGPPPEVATNGNSEDGRVLETEFATGWSRPPEGSSPRTIRNQLLPTEGNVRRR
jgi:hypothetical protein